LCLPCEKGTKPGKKIMEILLGFYLSMEKNILRGEKKGK